MARDFTGGYSSADNIQRASAFAVDMDGVGITIALFVRFDTVDIESGSRGLVSLGTGDKAAIWLGKDAGTDKIRCVVKTAASGAGLAANTAATPVTTNTWYHFAMTYPGGAANPEDLKIYQDGSDATDSTGGTTTASGDTSGNFILGNFENTNNGLDGQLAEVAVWEEELDAQEVAALASGVAPSLVRPGTLKHYVPLVNTAQDVVYGGTLTDNGTVVYAHPRVYSPAPSTPVVVSDVPRVISVSTDDDVPATEDPWTIVGTRFGAR